MDPKIASRFNDTLLKDAMQRYDIPADKIELLNGFESFIYEFNVRWRLVQCIGTACAAPDMIWARWIDQSPPDGGTTVARRCSPGNLVELVDDGRRNSCTASQQVYNHKDR
jgi:hypothetical protein